MLILKGWVLVQRAVQAVICDGRHDRVDPVVDGGRHQLDTAAVRCADHADPRVAGTIEADFGLRRQPADDRGDIAALEVRRVDLQLAARAPFTARVPGDNVVAVPQQRCHTDDVVGQERIFLGGGVRLAGQRQTRTIEDGRRLLPCRKTFAPGRNGRRSGCRQTRSPSLLAALGYRPETYRNRVTDDRVEKFADKWDLVQDPDNRGHDQRSNYGHLLQPCQRRRLLDGHHGGLDGCG